MYYGHIVDKKQEFDKCWHYQGVLLFQVRLISYKAPFGTITKCVDYAGVLIFRRPD